MLRFHVAAVAIAAILIPVAGFAQDASRAVAGGGISVAGWSGKIDANEARRGSTINNAKFEQQSNAFHIVTGPAAAYWREADKATGDYTVKATFTEPKYMNLNSHPHPYGVFIAGSDLSGDSPSYLYCEAYGDGRFVVRGFGPQPFQLNGPAGAESPAVHKAAGKDQEVKQEVAISVKGGKVACLVNGTEVASFNKDAVIGAGKLKTLDGIFGIRTAHNTEVLVTGFGKN